MTLDTATLVAATAAAAVAGGGIRWSVDRFLAARHEARVEPLEELSYATKAAQAIVDASAALIVPLKQQLDRNAETARANSDKIDALEAVVAAMRISEAECRKRLTALEARP